MPQLLPGDTKPKSPQPQPPGSGGKGLDNRPPIPDQSPEIFVRRSAAREVAARTATFGMGTVQKHPHTVAGLVHSSLSTEKLAHLAKNLDEAYERVQMRNAMFAVHHDPGYMHPGGVASPEHHVTGIEINEQYRGAGLDEVQDYPTVEAGQADGPISGLYIVGNKVYRRGVHGPDPLLLSEMSAEEQTGIAALAAGENPVEVMAGAAMAPFQIAFGWAGDTLDDIGSIPGVGAIVRPIHATLDVSVNAVNTSLARAGRLVADVPAAGAMAVSEAINREGDVDTDWGALLDFWRLDRHDPFTTGVANVMGYHVDDPEFAETAASIDIIAGVVEQVVLAKIGVGINAKATITGEMGGFLDARTWADHTVLNGGMFNKLAELYDRTPPTPGLRVGRTLAATRRISPRLAKAFADAYAIGETRSAGIANMKQVFVDAVKKDAGAVKGRLNEVNDQLSSTPESPILKAERGALESQLETVVKADPIEQWPRYQDVRGALKGVPAVTRGARLMQAVYERRPFKAVTDITKAVDNLRSKPKLYDWDVSNVVADAMRQNAQNAGRWLRAARVPEEVVSRIIGEMTEGVTFEEWYRHVTEAASEHTAAWANPVQVKQLTTAMRNEEIYTNRANYTTQAADGGEIRRPIVEKANGVTPPTQMNELAHSANLPDVQIVHDTTAALARTKKNFAVGAAKKWFDNAMAGWRAQTIFSRGPAISLTIQMEELLTRFMTNAMAEPGRFGDWLVHKLPLSEEAQASVARRLGFEDMARARARFAEMKKHPEMLGQTMTDVANETALRIESPIKRFRQDFLDGTIDATSKEAKEVFADLVWEIEHTATSADTRTLMAFGPERTARVLLGENLPGRAPIPEGAVRLFSEQRATKLGAIRERGIEAAAKGEVEKPVVWSQERLEGTNAQRVIRGELGEEHVMVEHWAPEAEARRVGTSGADAVQTGAVPPERIIRVWESGKAPQASDKMMRWGAKIVEDTSSDPSYAGLGPRERVVEFLTRKEESLKELTGNHPEVVDLMSNGRTRLAKLADPNGELDLVQDELNQLHLTQQEGGLSQGMQLSLVERRKQLLDGAAEQTAGRRLRVSANNTAIRDWLMNEALEGRYELPKYRRSLMKKGAYETSQGMHRGFMANVQRVQYSAMRFMNRDAMRAGFSEQAYTKWYRRYKRAGWTESQADQAAVAQAMFDARDWLHDIGNKSSFQRFFKNEAPFYHAWERVAYRWFVKVPNMMGAGFTPLGWALESNIVNGTIDALKHVGVIQERKNPDGTTELHTYLPNPVALLNWIPGVEAPSKIDVFDPKTALFPPLHLLSHPPGLAPQTLFALSEIADLTHVEWLKDLHDEVTMHGAFSIQFPGAGQATKIWEAITGDVPPWAIGHSRRYQEYVVGRSRDAALRYAYTEMVNTDDPMPNSADFDTRAEYVQARNSWWGRWTALADEYHTGLSLTNLLAVESPLTSFRPTTKEEVAWKQFLEDNDLMGERDQDDWDLIDDYLSDHPESLAYNVGAYTEDSKWPKDEGYEAFKDAVGRGDIKLLDEEDFRSKLALSQEWEFKNQTDARQLRKAGLGDWHKWSPQKKLLHYGEYTDATRAGWDSFNEFLDADKDAKALYEANRSEVSEINDQIQETKANATYLERAGKNPDKILQGLYSRRAEATDFGSTTSDHLRWYRNVVMNDYYDATNAIYDRIEEIEESGAPNKDAMVERQYDRLRQLNATWPEIIAPDGKKYPPPEQYLYTSKTEEERHAARTKWASVPPSWLSPFQYETTFGPADGKIKSYFNAEQEVSSFFDEKTRDMSHSSDEYNSWVKWRETSLDLLAKRNGTDEIRRLERAPKIVRMSTAGLTPDSEGMTWIVDQSQAIATRLAARGSNQWSSSEEAQYYRGWLESYIATMRDPQSKIYDARVDQFFTRQQHVTGITYDPALYRYVLFGITGTFELPIDYSQENKAASE